MSLQTDLYLGKDKDKFLHPNRMQPMNHHQQYRLPFSSLNHKTKIYGKCSLQYSLHVETTAPYLEKNVAYSILYIVYCRNIKQIYFQDD